VADLGVAPADLLRDQLVDLGGRGRCRVELFDLCLAARAEPAEPHRHGVFVPIDLPEFLGSAADVLERSHRHTVVAAVTAEVPLDGSPGFADDSRRGLADQSYSFRSAL